MNAKHRYENKKRADNPFTALSGIKAFQMIGGSNCLIVRANTIKGEKPCRFAYGLYMNMKKYSKSVKVKNSCGVSNCVKKEHLIAVFVPSEDDREYMRTYGQLVSREELAHYLRIPINVI